MFTSRFPDFLDGSAEPDEDIVYGHKFKWTSIHPSEADISHLLYSYDELATTALDRLDEIAPPETKGWRCPHAEGPGQRDLYALLQKHAAEDPVLEKLWEEVTAVPDWVDWEQIARGQRLLYKYSGQVLFGVSHSLPVFTSTRQMVTELTTSNLNSFFSKPSSEVWALLASSKPSPAPAASASTSAAAASLRPFSTSSP